VAVAGVMSVAAAGHAGAAAPNDQDSSYITSNAQTNLAEIAIGELALERAQNESTRELAQMTLTDHQAALAKLQAVADQLGVTLPDAPNTEQQSNAATLKSVSTAAFDATYAQIQVAGHQRSISGTNAEIAGGADPAVVEYAKGYLPVATHHLQMAQEVVAEVGGAPTAVPAGSAGLAAATSSTTVLAQVLLGAAGLGVLILGMAGLLRRRSLR
jgi:putative membrane protein